MRPLPCCRVAPLVTGALLALLAGLVAPPAARAGCGDYPHAAGSLENAANEAGLFRLPASRPASSDTPAARSTRQRGPAPGHLPCSGPSCSRSPLAPPPGPVAPPSAQPDQWGYLVSAAGLTPPQPFASLGEGRPALPARHPSGVYHPPR